MNEAIIRAIGEDITLDYSGDTSFMQDPRYTRDDAAPYAQRNGRVLRTDDVPINQFELMLRRLLGPMEEMWNRTEQKQYPMGKPPIPQIHPQTKGIVTPESINNARDPNRRIKL